MNDLNEIIWRNHYQICVETPDKKSQWYGSGFMLNYKGKLYFVTASHVIFPEKNTDIQYKYYLLTNDNNAESFELFNFFSSKSINLEELSDIEFDCEVDLMDWFSDIDLAVCEIKQPFPFNFVTHELKIGNEVLVPANLTKCRISEKNITPVEKNSKYRVYGVIRNKEVKSRLERTNALHYNITLNNIQNDGSIVMDYPSVKLDEWEALSGSLFFSDN